MKVLDRVIYSNVATLMKEKKYNFTILADKVGIHMHTVRRRLRGANDMRYFEAVAIKKALGTDMPLEELFREGVNG